MTQVSFAFFILALGLSAYAGDVQNAMKQNEQAVGRYYDALRQAPKPLSPSERTQLRTQILAPAQKSLNQATVSEWSKITNRLRATQYGPSQKIPLRKGYEAYMPSQEAISRTSLNHREEISDKDFKPFSDLGIKKESFYKFTDALEQKIIAKGWNRKKPTATELEKFIFEESKQYLEKYYASRNGNQKDSALSSSQERGVSTQGAYQNSGGKKFRPKTHASPAPSKLTLDGSKNPKVLEFKGDDEEETTE